MHIWVLFAIIAGIGMLGYNLCAKFGGGALPPQVFAGVMYISGTIIVLPIFVAYLLKQPDGYITSLPLKPVLLTVGAAISVVIVDLAVSKMFNLGAEVGLGMTSISMISIFLTALIGYFFIKEGYSSINIMGLALALVAVPMIFHGAK
ncbi:MAG: hypothetical protein CMH31_00315 [Micavibrio sp.]|nr:hypothetical protein [Micavibrio sp.]